MRINFQCDDFDELEDLQDFDDLEDLSENEENDEKRGFVIMRFLANFKVICIT